MIYTTEELTGRIAELERINAELETQLDYTIGLMNEQSTGIYFLLHDETKRNAIIQAAQNVASVGMKPETMLGQRYLDELYLALNKST